MTTRRRLTVAFLAIVLFPVLLVAAAAGWLAYERTSDPLDALRRDPGGIRLVHDSVYPVRTASGEHRLFRDLTLDTDDAGTIRVTTSRPAAGVRTPLPLVMILAGLRTGRESLTVIDRHGPSLLVGYEYPYDQETWYRSAPIGQVPAIRRAVLNVPWQVTYVVGSFADDPTVDPDRSALLGYSFGAMFVPAVQRLAQAEGHAFDASILAFGGADIQALLEANLDADVGHSLLRRALAWTAASLLHPMEPAHHLPHLTGQFLLIRGASDSQVPADLSARMAALAPEPKDVVTLDAGHMNPRNTELTERVIRLSQEWLRARGVIE